MAKAVNNDKAQPGKTTAAGKPATKAARKGADNKPVRSSGAKAVAKAKAGAKSSDKRSIGKFLREVRVELRKVTWPTRKELVQSTVVVLVAVAIATVYTFALDTAFSRFVDLVVRVIT